MCHFFIGYTTITKCILVAKAVTYHGVVGAIQNQSKFIDKSLRDLDIGHCASERSQCVPMFVLEWMHDCVLACASKCCVWECVTYLPSGYWEKV